MQALPAPVTQIKALNLADIANKNSTSVNKSSSENAKASFQAVLNKQVQTKRNQTQEKPDGSKDAAKSPTHKKTAENSQTETAKTLQPEQVTEALNDVSSNDSFLTDLNKQLDSARDMTVKSVVDEIKDLPPVDLTANADLISSLGMPAIIAAQDTTNKSQQLATPVDAEAALLDGSLAKPQSNLINTFQNVATSEQPQQSVDNNLKPEVKFSVKDDVVLNKEMVNLSKDLPTKDLVAKDPTPNAVQVQAASINSVQNNSNIASQQLASTNFINVYPGKSGWDQAISQKVVWMLGAGQQSASLTLNPPDLGPLKVVISVHNDQANTTFISDNDEVRKALESGMSNLRDKMNESGIQLGQANVSTSQQSQQQFQQASQDRSVGSQSSLTNIEHVQQDAPAQLNLRVSNGLVDTFA